MRAKLFLSLILPILAGIAKVEDSAADVKPVEAAADVKRTGGFIGTMFGEEEGEEDDGVVRRGFGDMVGGMFGSKKAEEKDEVKKECAEEVCPARKGLGDILGTMFDPKRKKPETKPDSKPDSKPGTKPETKPERPKSEKFSGMFKDMVETRPKRPVKVPGKEPGKKPDGEKPSEVSILPVEETYASICEDSRMRTMLTKVGKKLETLIWDKKFQQFTFHDAMELGFGTLHTLKDSWCDDYKKLSDQMKGDSKGQFKRFSKFLIKTFDEVGTDVPARHFKEFISQFERMHNVAMGELGETGFHIDRKKQTSPKEPAKDSPKPADAVKTIKTRSAEVAEKAKVTRTTCKESVQMAKKFHKKFATILKRVRTIYRKHFDSKNKKHDSVGVVFGAGYSIAKHVFLNKNACSKLLGGIDEIEEEMGDDMANRFKDPTKLLKFEENPVGIIMDLMDGKLGKLAGKLREFLKTDKTKPLERNAKFGWMVLSDRLKLSFKMLPELFEFLDEKQRTDPEVKDEIGFVFEALDENNVDVPEMAKRQEDFARLVGEESICDHALVGEACEELKTLRSIWDSITGSNSEVITFSVLTLVGLLLL